MATRVAKLCAAALRRQRPRPQGSNASCSSGFFSLMHREISDPSRLPSPLAPKLSPIPSSQALPRVNPSLHTTSGLAASLCHVSGPRRSKGSVATEGAKGSHESEASDGKGEAMAGSKEAEELPAKVLEELAKSTEESFGEHQFTASTHLNLAHAYFREGDGGAKVFAAAQKAWKWFDVHSNSDSLERIMCLHIMAAAKIRMGQFPEALPLLEMASGLADETKGEKYAMMLFASHMLTGDAWQLLGAQLDAREAFVKALAVQERQLAADDPRIANTCRRLADAHAQLMEFEQAEPLAVRALNIHMQMGEVSIEEAVDRRLLAAIYAGLDEPERALMHLEAAKGVLAERGGRLDTALTEAAIGDMLVTMEKPEEAMAAFETALHVMVELLGEEHPSVAAVYASSADASLKAGKVKEAEEFCEKSLRIYEKGEGDDLVETANGLTEISGIYSSLGNLGRAIELLRRALLLRLRVPGQLFAAAGTEASMAVLLLSAGFNKLALDALRSCKDKMKAACGEDHPLIVRVLYYEALALTSGGLELGSEEEALELLKQARAVLEKSKLQDVPEAVDVYSSLADLHEKGGRLREAVECLGRVVEGKEALLGRQHPEVAACKKRLADVSSRM